MYTMCVCVCVSSNSWCSRYDVSELQAAQPVLGSLLSSETDCSLFSTVPYSLQDKSKNPSDFKHVYILQVSNHLVAAHH